MPTRLGSRLIFSCSPIAAELQRLASDNAADGVTCDRFNDSFSGAHRDPGRASYAAIPTQSAKARLT